MAISDNKKLKPCFYCRVPSKWNEDHMNWMCVNSRCKRGQVMQHLIAARALVKEMVKRGDSIGTQY
ncbi:hypothetical protein BC936DRAFT_147206 [Jimgerdemannia flammicorona]|uniref:Uncharacterized protein n=1 Tax=Jimgerdemannia flammicorona TaxID=994334 RepID=A0A433D5U8_9FUNG|nr:hypothetical protein BC936DRAFT_147206 [Jimgerdemannia flammicorona]